MRTHPYLTFASLSALLCVLITLSLWIALTNRERSQFKRAEANLQLALKGTGQMLFEYAGAINDGRKITHDTNLQVLLKTLEVHQQLSDENPGDAFALHRLAVAHYFLANGYARLDRRQDTVKHYEQFRDIVEQLLEIDPENPKYIFDGFMSHYRIAGELARRDQPDEIDQLRNALLAADKHIRKLLAKFPADNVAYADAYNSFQVFKLSVLFGDDADQELQNVRDSSLSLWRQNQKQQALAKPAIQAMYRKARLAVSRGNLIEAKQFVEEAYQLQNEVFPLAERDFGTTQICLQTHFDSAIISIALDDWLTADTRAAEAIEDLKLLKDHQPTLRESHCRLLKLRSEANRKMGNSEAAIEYERMAHEAAEREGIDMQQEQVCIWIDAIIAGDKEKAEQYFPLR